MRYVHVVFTLPHELAPLALANQKTIYTLLFRLSAETLLQFARDPRLLGAEIGFFSVLHTWNQKLEHHPHVHSVIPEGGISLDGSHWVRPRCNFFLPVKAMAKAFRGKFLDALKTAFAAGELRFPGQLKNLSTPRAFAALLRQCCRHKWVVYAKRPFGGPEHVLKYLGNYTHRVAISNHRLVALDNGQVSFRWRDSAHNNKKRVMDLRVEEFLRRFFLHVLQVHGQPATPAPPGYLPQTSNCAPTASHPERFYPNAVEHRILALSEMWRPHGPIGTTKPCSVATSFPSGAHHPTVMKRSFPTRICRAFQGQRNKCGRTLSQPTARRRRLCQLLGKWPKFRPHSAANLLLALL